MLAEEEVQKAVEVVKKAEEEHSKRRSSTMGRMAHGVSSMMSHMGSAHMGGIHGAHGHGSTSSLHATTTHTAPHGRRDLVPESPSGVSVTSESPSGFGIGDDSPAGTARHSMTRRSEAGGISTVQIQSGDEIIESHPKKRSFFGPLSSGGRRSDKERGSFASEASCREGSMRSDRGESVDVSAVSASVEGEPTVAKSQSY